MRLKTRLPQLFVYPHLRLFVLPQKRNLKRVWSAIEDLSSSF